MSLSTRRLLVLTVLTSFVATQVASPLLLANDHHGGHDGGGWDGGSHHGGGDYGGDWGGDWGGHHHGGGWGGDAGGHHHGHHQGHDWGSNWTDQVHQHWPQSHVNIYDPWDNSGYSTPSYPNTPAYTPAYTPVAPPSNSLPGMAHAPQVPQNAIPVHQPVAVPRNNLPQRGRTKVVPKTIQPPRNAVPGTPSGPIVLVAKVVPAKNKPVDINHLPLTAQQIDKLQKQIQQALDAARQQLERNRPGEQEVERILQNELTKLAQQEIQKINELVRQARTAELALLAAERQLAAAVARELQQLARINQLITRALNQINRANLQALIGALRTLPRSQAALLAAIELQILRQLAGLLRTARPGFNPIPRGIVPLVRLPGMSRGAIVPLGNGCVLVGPGRSGPLPAGISMARGSVSQAAGIPLASGPAARDLAGMPARGVVLLNGGASEVGYVLNERSYTMRPEEKQELPGGKTWTVSFDRGNNGGTARYTLEEGTYEFRVEGTAWNLYRKSFRTTIDNTGSNEPFQFVMNNKQETVPAGEARTISDSFPPVVRFDNGAGETKQKQLDDGTFVVATNGDKGLLDLFSAASMQAAEQKELAMGQNREPQDFQTNEEMARPPALPQTPESSKEVDPFADVSLVGKDVEK